MNRDEQMVAALARLGRKEASVAETRGTLRALGVERIVIEELIYIELGGSDVVRTGDDGREYCVRGDKVGRAVEDIRREML